MSGGAPKSCLCQTLTSLQQLPCEREPLTDKTRLVSTRRQILTECVSGRMLQPSTETVIANFSVPSDILMEGKVSWLGTVHPLLTLDVFWQWFFFSQEEDVVIRDE